MSKTASLPGPLAGMMDRVNADLSARHLPQSVTLFMGPDGGGVQSLVVQTNCTQADVYLRELAKAVAAVITDWHDDEVGELISVRPPERFTSCATSATPQRLCCWKRSRRACLLRSRFPGIGPSG